MPAKTRIYLVRHGEVAGIGVFRYNGQSDVPLTPKGIEQFSSLAGRLRDKPIAACYSSDLSRCVQGAEMLCAGRRIKPVLKRELRELCFGEWEGRTWSELAEKYPDEWQARMKDYVNYRVPGGENLLDLANRVIPEIKKIIAGHPDQEVLVVAHGGANRIILLDALGAPFTSMFRIEQDFGSLNIIDYYADGNPVVKLLNG